MQTKTCNICKIEKPINEYNKEKRGKYGVKARCIICEKEKGIEYRKNNKEKIKSYKKEYRKNNKEKIKKAKQEHYKKNKEKINEKHKKYRIEYYQINKKKIQKKQKIYRDNNPEKMTEKSRKWYKKNKDYYQNNKEIISRRRKLRRKNNLQYKLMNNIRVRLHDFLKNRKIYKNNKTMMTVGCSPQQLTDWVKYNIDLDDLNEYHIDHVKPLASFNCKTYEEVIECKCNHWTNLIPTSPEYNLIKSDREPTKHELFKQELRIYLFKNKKV